MGSHVKVVPSSHSRNHHLRLQCSTALGICSSSSSSTVVFSTGECSKSRSISAIRSGSRPYQHAFFPVFTGDKSCNPGHVAVARKRPPQRPAPSVLGDGRVSRREKLEPADGRCRNVRLHGREIPAPVQAELGAADTSLTQGYT